MLYPRSPEFILSFRHLLTEAVTDLLIERDMACPLTAEAVGELVVTLSSYREEGSPLFPQVFVCDDITEMLQALRGRDPISINDGPRSRETMRRALKQCAALCQGGWALYFVREAEDLLSYGLFRTDSFILSETPIELLRAIKDPHLKVLGISRVAENIIEICGSDGFSRFMHLSGARSDVAHPTKVLDDLVEAVTADVPDPLKLATQGFFRRTFFNVMQAPHGSLAAVVPMDLGRIDLLADGVLLQPPVDVVSRIEAYLRDPREEKSTSLQALVSLLRGMMSSDGITVLRSDGCLLGYNVFVEQATAAADIGVLIGGARRRTFNVLCQHLGNDLSAAFYRSQDGHALCERAPCPQPAAQPAVVPPAVEQVVAPAPQPAVVPPAVEQVVAPAPQPAVVPPAVEQAVRLVAQPVVVPPAVEQVVRLVAQPAIVPPAMLPVVQPIVEPTVELVTQPTVQPVVMPTLQPLAQPPVRTIARKPVLPPVVKPVVKPVAKPAVEPFVEQAVEPFAEPTRQPAVEPIAEPSAPSAAEPANEPFVRTLS